MHMHTRKITYWTVSNDTGIPHTSPYLTCILVYNCPVSSLRLQRLQWYRRPNEILLAQRKNVPTPAKILATTCMVVHTARHASRTTFSLLTRKQRRKQTRLKQQHLSLSQLVTMKSVLNLFIGKHELMCSIDDSLSILVFIWMAFAHF